MLRVLPAGLLAGWTVGDWPVSITAAPLELWTAIGDAAPRRSATGKLIPWGRGWAMLID